VGGRGLIEDILYVKLAMINYQWKNNKFKIGDRTPPKKFKPIKEDEEEPCVTQGSAIL